jgi:hypothetical protein
MEAGKGFDAIIARQVMGWTKATLHDDVTGPEAYWCMGGKAMAPVDSFTPSTDIASAWKVVEWLVRLPGPNGDHHSVQIDYSVDAVVVIDEHEEWRVSAIAATAPLAICLAALKAVQP